MTGGVARGRLTGVTALVLMAAWVESPPERGLRDGVPRPTASSKGAD
jgi:hypothetical protein